MERIKIGKFTLLPHQTMKVPSVAHLYIAQPFVDTVIAMRILAILLQKRSSGLISANFLT